MIKIFCKATAVVLLATHLAWAGESGSTIKADSLRAEPYLDAKVTAQIAKGEHADILKTSGGWSQVKTAKGTGWVRMLSIRRDAARNSAASGSSLAALASGRSGKGNIVATTGIRGLNEEELKAAKYSESEIKLAESYGSSKAEAQRFAQSGKLVTQQIDYLPATGGAQ